MIQRTLQKIKHRGVMYPEKSIQDRAAEVLTAVATLGVIASIADGHADKREIDYVTRIFRKRFLLSRQRAVLYITTAIERIRAKGPAIAMAAACTTLNEHLESNQKLTLFKALAEVLALDGVVHEGEESYLAYLALKLQLPELRAHTEN